MSIQYDSNGFPTFVPDEPAAVSAQTEAPNLWRDRLKPTVDKAVDLWDTYVQPAVDVGMIPFKVPSQLLGTSTATIGDIISGAPKPSVRVLPGSNWKSDLLGESTTAPNFVDQIINAPKSIAANLGGPSVAELIGEKPDINATAGLGEQTPQEVADWQSRHPVAKYVKPLLEAGTRLGIDWAINPAYAGMRMFSSIGEVPALLKAVEAASIAGKTTEAAAGAARAAAILKGSKTMMSIASGEGIGSFLMAHPGVAPAAERAIGAALVPGMVQGAIQGVRQTAQQYQDQGLSPETVTSALQTGTDAVFAGLALRHSLHPTPVGQPMTNLSPERLSSALQGADLAQEVAQARAAESGAPQVAVEPQGAPLGVASEQVPDAVPAPAVAPAAAYSVAPEETSVSVPAVVAAPATAEKPLDLESLRSDIGRYGKEVVAPVVREKFLSGGTDFSAQDASSLAPSGATPEDIESIRQEGLSRLVASMGGRKWLNELNARYGREGPDIQVVPIGSPGENTNLVLQRSGGEIIGAGQGKNGFRQMMAGGRDQGSPHSISPVYSELDRLGYRPSDDLSPQGREAQESHARKLGQLAQESSSVRPDVGLVSNVAGPESVSGNPSGGGQVLAVASSDVSATPGTDLDRPEPVIAASKREAYQALRERYPEQAPDVKTMVDKHGLKPEWAIDINKKWGNPAWETPGAGRVAYSVPEEESRAQRSSEEAIVKTMQEMNPSVLTGDHAYIPHLRQALAEEIPKKAEFDKAMIDLAKRGIIGLQEHPVVSNMKDSEKQSMISNGKGGYYISAGLDPTRMPAEMRSASNPRDSEAVVRAILGMNPQALSGAVEYIPRLRAQLSDRFATKSEFDKAVLGAFDRHEIQLQSHPVPAEIGPSERSQMIPDGSGSYYMVAGLRRGEPTSDALVARAISSAPEPISVSDQLRGVRARLDRAHEEEFKAYQDYDRLRGSRPEIAKVSLDAAEEATARRVAIEDQENKLILQADAETGRTAYSVPKDRAQPQENPLAGKRSEQQKQRAARSAEITDERENLENEMEIIQGRVDRKEITRATAVDLWKPMIARDKILEDEQIGLHADSMEESSSAMKAFDESLREAVKGGLPVYRAETKADRPAFTSIQGDLPRVQANYGDGYSVGVSQDGQRWVVSPTSNKGVSFEIGLDNNIRVNPEEYAKQYGKPLSELQAQMGALGQTRIGGEIPWKATISLAKDRAGTETLNHETFHVATFLALGPDGVKQMQAKYGQNYWQERAADAYAKWAPEHPNTLFTPIHDFFRKIWQAITGQQDRTEEIFRSVQNGKIFKRMGGLALNDPTARAEIVRYLDARPPETKKQFALALASDLGISDIVRHEVGDSFLFDATNLLRGTARDVTRPNPLGVAFLRDVVDQKTNYGTYDAALTRARGFFGDDLQQKYQQWLNTRRLPSTGAAFERLRGGIKVGAVSSAPADEAILEDAKTISGDMRQSLGVKDIGKKLDSGAFANVYDLGENEEGKRLVARVSVLPGDNARPRMDSEYIAPEIGRYFTADGREVTVQPYTYSHEEVGHDAWKAKEVAADLAKKLEAQGFKDIDISSPNVRYLDKEGQHPVIADLGAVKPVGSDVPNSEWIANKLDVMPEYPEDPEVRARMLAEQGATELPLIAMTDGKFGDFWGRLNYLFVNKYHYLERAEKGVYKYLGKGDKVPKEESAASALEVFPSRAWKRIEDVVEKGKDEMNALAARDNATMAEMWNRLNVEHAPVRNRWGRQRKDVDGGPIENAIGFSDAEAAERRAKMEADGTWERTQAAADRFHAMMRQQLDLAEEYGLLPPEKIAALRADPEWAATYVPQKHEDPLNPWHSVSGASGVRPTMKHFTGRKTEAENPIGFGCAQLAQTIAQGERNLSWRKLADFIDNNPDQGWQVLDEAPKKETLEERVRPELLKAEKDLTGAYSRYDAVVEKSKRAASDLAKAKDIYSGSLEADSNSESSKDLSIATEKRERALRTLGEMKGKFGNASHEYADAAARYERYNVAYNEAKSAQASYSKAAREQSEAGKTFALAKSTYDKAMADVSAADRQRSLAAATHEQAVSSGPRKIKVVGEVPDMTGLIPYVAPGGVTRYLKINDARVLESLRKAGPDTSAQVLKYISAGMRFYSGMLTRWNPEFLLPNGTRDLQMALAAIGVEHKAGAMRDVLKGVGSGIKAAWRVLGNPEAGGEWEDAYREYAKNGAPMNVLQLKSGPEYMKEVERELEALKHPNQYKNAFFKTVNFIDRANGAVETGVRLSYYKYLRSRGASEEAATHGAKNVTVNFDRRGALGPTLNSLYLFFNASMQGGVRVAKVLNSPRGRMAGLAMMSAGFAMDQMNAAATNDSNGDGISDWDSVPEYVKERNLLIGKATIPMPYGFNVLVNSGRLISAWSRGQMSAGTAASNGALSALSTFNPFGGASDFTQMVTPSFLEPFVQLSMNKNFAGNAIVPEQPKWGPQKPNSERFWRTTSPVAQWLAQTGNRLTGGDELTKGYVDISPNTIEYWSNFALGGWSRVLTGAEATVEGIASGEGVPLSKIPIVRRQVYEEHPADVGRMWRATQEEMDQLKARAEMYMKQGRPDKVGQLPRPLIGISDYMAEVQRQTEEIQKAQRAGVISDKDAQERVRQMQIRGLFNITKARERAKSMGYNPGYAAAPEAGV